MTERRTVRQRALGQSRVAKACPRSTLEAFATELKDCHWAPARSGRFDARWRPSSWPRRCPLTGIDHRTILSAAHLVKAAMVSVKWLLFRQPFPASNCPPDPFRLGADPPAPSSRDGVTSYFPVFMSTTPRPSWHIVLVSSFFDLVKLRRRPDPWVFSRLPSSPSPWCAYSCAFCSNWVFACEFPLALC